MGISKCRTQQMADFLLQNNPNPKINCTVNELVKYYIEEGNIEGISHPSPYKRKEGSISFVF